MNTPLQPFSRPGAADGLPWGGAPSQTFARTAVELMAAAVSSGRESRAESDRIRRTICRRFARALERAARDRDRPTLFAEDMTCIGLEAVAETLWPLRRRLRSPASAQRLAERIADDLTTAVCG